MTIHIEIERLKDAAERKIRLDSSEWKHIEECRLCMKQLRDAIRASDSKAQSAPSEPTAHR
jgi:hypothetical protein